MRRSQTVLRARALSHPIAVTPVSVRKNFCHMSELHSPCPSTLDTFPGGFPLAAPGRRIAPVHGAGRNASCAESADWSRKAFGRSNRGENRAVSNSRSARACTWEAGGEVPVKDAISARPPQLPRDVELANPPAGPFGAVKRGLKRLILDVVDTGWLGLPALRTHVVICGFVRSGSTLLQVMCESCVHGVKGFPSRSSDRRDHDAPIELITMTEMRRSSMPPPAVTRSGPLGPLCASVGPLSGELASASLASPRHKEARRSNNHARFLGRSRIPRSPMIVDTSSMSAAPSCGTLSQDPSATNRRSACRSHRSRAGQDRRTGYPVVMTGRHDSTRAEAVVSPVAEGSPTASRQSHRQC